MGPYRIIYSSIKNGSFIKQTRSFLKKLGKQNNCRYFVCSYNLPLSKEGIGYIRLKVPTYGIFTVYFSAEESMGDFIDVKSTTGLATTVPKPLSGDKPDKWKDRIFREWVLYPDFGAKSVLA